jgi:hypothetical protein
MEEKEMFLHRRLRPRWALTCACLVTALTGHVLAEVTFHGDPLRIEVSSALGTGSYTVQLSDLVWSASAQSALWVRSAPLPIYDPESGRLLASFNSVTFRLVRGSRIDVNLSCRAGAADATIILHSGSLAFTTISSAAAQGMATATVSLADTDGDGVALAGVGPPGTGIHQSFINPESGPGSLFSTLLGSIAIGPGGSGSAIQSDPPSGYRLVGAAVSNMAVVLAFTLTADDIGSANSTFAIQPYPADVALDSDGDGRPDFIDGCPADPAKADPGLCGCGVPDVDTDEDGVLDCLDNCPTVPNPDQEDLDGDGVGDACDSDQMPHSSGPEDPGTGSGTDAGKETPPK